MALLSRLNLSKSALTAFSSLFASLMLGLVLSSPASALGGPLLDLEGSTWDLPAVENNAKAKVKVKSGGKAKVQSYESMSISFDEAGNWSGQLTQSVAISGTYTSEKKSSRNLILTLDQASIEALEAHEAQLAEQELAQQGTITSVSLTVTKSTIRAKVSTLKKFGTASLKLAARFQFTGSVTIIQGNSQYQLKASARLRGTSLAVPLADITAS